MPAPGRTAPRSFAQERLRFIDRIKALRAAPHPDRDLSRPPLTPVYFGAFDRDGLAVADPDAAALVEGTA